MRVTALTATPVSVPYRHREVSSVIRRDGVTDVVVRIDTDEGLVGWGESCSGADVVSVAAAIDAMRPFVIGQDPWDHEVIRARLYSSGLWQFRAPTANFAYAGIDMALWDLCGHEAGQPLYRLLGGAIRSSVNYFYYLARGASEDLEAQCVDGVAAGYSVFYLKVGVDDRSDLEMVKSVRDALGDVPRLRLDANGSWDLPQAKRMLSRLQRYDIDFMEQPVREDPVEHLGELRQTSPIPICANEGLWSVAQAYERIRARQADVYCFSPYWVGGLINFQRLSQIAHLEGALVCKHTHGELGLAAAAGHHVMLTLPNAVQGNQQTASLNAGDILDRPLPITTGPNWGLVTEPGLGVQVDPDALAGAAEAYERDGQYLPYQPEMLTW